MAMPSWSRLEALFADALERPAPERDGFLDEACAEDAPLRDELRRMLAAHEGEGGLLLERQLAPDGPAEDLLVGQCFGAFRLVRRIGEGGMGAVYLAERADREFTQQVAVKVVSAIGARRGEVVERFRHERRILAALVHPGIARLVDGGLGPGGQPYLAMEYVDGEPITTHCDRRRLSVAQRLALFRHACDAVDHAHRNLVVHRDIKPSNVFVTPAGEVKLLDFGIAKLLGASDTGASGPVTRTGFRPMTPEYAAPEQLAGSAITTATDVYALGVLLFELLTGLRPPPAGEPGSGPARTVAAVRPSTAAVGQARLAAGEPARDAAERACARATSPARLRRLLQGDLDTIVAMALHEEPERRYASAGQLSEDVVRALEGQPVRAQRDTAVYRLRRFVRRHWAGVGLAATVAAVLVGFLAFSIQQARAVARERDVARAERDKAGRVVDLLVELFEGTSPRVLPRGDRLTLGEFLPQAERRALERLEDQPDLAAHLRLVLGRVAHARGRYAEAQAHLGKALEQLRRIAGPDDPETLDAALALGATLLELRRHDEARPILQDVYDRSAWRRDERAAEAALLLANAMGVRPEAERLLRESLDVRQSATPPDARSVSRSLINLGNFLVLADRTDEGVPLLEAALARLDTPALRATPQLLTVLNDLGQARVRGEDLAEAERLQRRVLEVAPSIVEPDSLPVANALNNLGGVLAAQGRHAEAERVLRESFALHERLFDAPHARTANVARNLGIAIGLQQRPAEAHAWIDRAIGLMSLAGANPAATAWMRAQRATMASRLGRLDEALRGTEQAIADIGQADTPQLKAHLAECRLLHGGLLLRAGRPAEAMGPLEAALAHFSAATPVSRSKVAWVDVEIGRALAALGRCHEARSRLASIDVYAAWGLAAPDRVADGRRARAQCAGAEPPAMSPPDAGGSGGKGPDTGHDQREH